MSVRTGLVLVFVAQFIVFVVGITWSTKLVSGHSAKNHNLKLLTTLFCFVGISVTVVSAFIALKTIDYPFFKQTIVATWAWIGAITACLGALAFTRRCTSCNRLNARKETDKTMVGQQTTHRLVTREVPVKKPFQIIPELFPSKISVREHVPVLRTTYRIEYQCRYCNHSWSELSSQETSQ